MNARQQALLAMNAAMNVLRDEQFLALAGMLPCHPGVVAARVAAEGLADAIGALVAEDPRLAAAARAPATSVTIAADQDLLEREAGRV